MQSYRLHDRILMGKYFALLTAALTLSGGLRAQDWERIGPDGGMPVALEIPDPNGHRVYALGMGELHRSDDRGLNWSMLPPPQPGIQVYSEIKLRISQDDPDAVLMFSRERIWRSLDGGHSWTVLNVQPPSGAVLEAITEVAVSPDDAARISVFMRTSGQFPTGPGPYTSYLWQTIDGQTPASVSPLGSQVPHCNQLVPSHHDQVHSAIYALGDLYYAHIYDCSPMDPLGDSGLGNRVHRLGGGLSVRVSIPSPLTPGMRLSGQLFVSGAALYTRVTERLHRIDPTAGTSVVARDTSTRAQALPDGSIVSGEPAGLFRSTNQGASWTRIDNATSGLDGNARTHLHATGFTAPSRWLIGNSDGIFRSDSAGSEWTPSHEGFSSLSFRAVAAHPANGNRLWLGTASMIAEGFDYRPRDRVLFTTADGGDSWTFGDLANRAVLVRSIVPDPDASHADGDAVLYASGMGCISALRCPPGTAPGQNLFKSIDAGVSWQSLGSELASAANTVRSLALSSPQGPSGMRVLHAPHRQGLGNLHARSLDSGNTWLTNGQGLPGIGDANSSSTALDVKVSPGNPLRVYLATEAYPYVAGSAVQANGVFRSDDGGASWSHRALGLPLRAGTTSEVGVLALALHTTNPDVAWALTLETTSTNGSDYANRVFKSTNAGNSWHEASTGLPSADHRSLIADPHDANLLYVGGTAGVFFSIDGGDTWQALGSPSPTTTLALAANSHHVFAAGSAGLFRIERPERSNVIYCDGFDGVHLIRRLDPHCSGRLFRLPARSDTP